MSRSKKRSSRQTKRREARRGRRPRPFPARVAAAILAIGLAGCGRTAAVFPTASELPHDRRRPDGVAIDPATAPPPPRDHASADEGLVSLRAPLGTAAALGTIAEMFRRIVREDSEGLYGLLTRDVRFVLASSPGQLPSWEQRFRRLDYTRLADQAIYHEPELEVYRAEDVADAPGAAALRVDGMAESDVVVRVPIATARAGLDRLLGDEMVIWLRREGERYRIYRVQEDFQLP